MKKTRPTPKNQPGQVEVNQQPDYTPEVDLDCIAGDCFDGPDDAQRTFIEPCSDCDPCGLPSESSREGHLLIELAMGQFVSNESFYQTSPSLNEHDGRKALSTLRNDYCVPLEWFYVNGQHGARKHRIIPACLPNVQKAIKSIWGRDVEEAARLARARANKSIKPAAIRKRKGGLR